MNKENKTHSMSDDGCFDSNHIKNQRFPKNIDEYESDVYGPPYPIHKKDEPENDDKTSFPDDIKRQRVPKDIELDTPCVYGPPPIIKRKRNISFVIVVLIFAQVEKAKALQPGLYCDLFQVVY